MARTRDEAKVRILIAEVGHSADAPVEITGRRAYRTECRQYCSREENLLGSSHDRGMLAAGDNLGSCG